jgi:hypothetical protein
LNYVVFVVFCPKPTEAQEEEEEEHQEDHPSRCLAQMDGAGFLLFLLLLSGWNITYRNLRNFKMERRLHEVSFIILSTKFECLIGPLRFTNPFLARRCPRAVGRLPARMAPLLLMTLSGSVLNP